MKIFIFSDSHNNTAPMQRVLIKYKDQYDHVFHLGDCCEDTKYIDKNIGPRPSLYVAGNRDFCFPGSKDKFPFERTVEFCGKKIYMCHGHLLRVKSELDTISKHAKALGCSVAIFGHTHVPTFIEKSGVFLCNPGSVGVPTSNRLTYGILTLEQEKIDFEIMEAE